MFLAYNATAATSFSEIGGYFGNRDHTTVIHGVNASSPNGCADDPARRRRDRADRGPKLKNLRPPGGPRKNPGGAGVGDFWPGCVTFTARWPPPPPPTPPTRATRRPPTTAAFHAAEAVCRRHARSLPLRQLLPAPRASGSTPTRVYAFCRLVDDAVDETPGGVGGQAAPSSTDFDNGVLTDPLRRPACPTGSSASGLWILEAFADVVRRREIPERYFRELLDGVRMDLTARAVRRLARSCEDYCYHVAGVVGLMMCHVFGDRRTSIRPTRRRSPTATRCSSRTSCATSARTWSAGRLYLPAGRHGPKCGVDIHDLEPPQRHAGVPRS